MQLIFGSEILIFKTSVSMYVAKPADHFVDLIFMWPKLLPNSWWGSLEKLNIQALLLLSAFSLSFFQPYFSFEQPKFSRQGCQVIQEL